MRSQVELQLGSLQLLGTTPPRACIGQETSCCQEVFFFVFAVFSGHAFKSAFKSVQKRRLEEP
jgi:hypothetical protein